MTERAAAEPTVVFGAIETTEGLGELAKALAVAQGKIQTAAKDSVNPHFNRSYADLASVWEACREPLASNGLSIVQQPVSDGDRVGVVTTLLHASGQWMRSTLWIVPERPGPQPLGSALTYGRRYSLAAFVGVAPAEDDDDGNSAQGGNGNGKQRAQGKPAARPPAAPAAKKAPAAAREPGSDDGDTAPAAGGAAATPDQKNRLLQSFKKLGWPAPHVGSWLQKHAGVNSVSDLGFDKATELQTLLDNHETQAA